MCENAETNDLIDEDVEREVEELSDKEKKFFDFPLSNEIKEALDINGFIHPTKIQEKTLETVLAGKDVIGQAKTGTGKTLAFAIPTLEKVDVSKLSTLVICPTRELAKQIAEEYVKLINNRFQLKVVCVYGGEERYKQIKKLKNKPQIIIGTPGRLIDFINSKKINLNYINSVVLDEADEMFNMGFREDIETILAHTPEDRQTLLFSATMPKPILELSKKFLTNPDLIKVQDTALTNNNILQTFYYINADEKSDLLVRLIDFFNVQSGIVFCNTKRAVDELVTYLQFYGYMSEGLHGDHKQESRERTMKSFKNGNIKILVATDVAARGIDVSNLEVVFNYDLPQEPEAYVHRIGRTGRAGKSGKSVSFVTRRGLDKLRQIENLTKIKMVKEKIPSVRSVRRQTMLRVLNENVKDIEQNELAGKMSDLLIETYEDKDQIINNLCSLILNKTTRNYKDIRNIDMPSKSKRTDKKKQRKQDFGFKPTKNEKVISINLSAGKGVTPKTIVDFLTRDTNIPRSAFGDIEIGDNYTKICVYSRHASKCIQMKNGKKFNRKIVKLKYS